MSFGSHHRVALKEAPGRPKAPRKAAQRFSV
jgi:hypothetical protein